MAARSNNLVLALALCALATTPAHAARGALALDAQRATVAGGRSVESATAVVVLAFGRGDASASGSLLKDSFDGDGFSASLGGAAVLARVVSLRGGVTRVVRHQALDAWTIRLGPEFHLGATTASLAGFRTQRDDGASTRGAALDLEHPLSPRVTARASASFARADGMPHAGSAALGARVHAGGPLHLTGEVGLARDPQWNEGVVGGLAPAVAQGQGARMTARLGARLLLL